MSIKTDKLLEIICDIFKNPLKRHIFDTEYGKYALITFISEFFSESKQKADAAYPGHPLIFL